MNPNNSGNPVSSVSVERSSAVTVLVVDDQLFIHKTLREMLAGEPKITCHFCSSAQRAVQMAIDLAPTVILLDVNMPEVDGITLVRQLRAHPDITDIPIVMLSANDDPQLKARSFETGANDYLVKLPDAIELIARLRYHSQAFLNRQARTEALLAQAQAKQLAQALQELKKTQAQLIQSEKLSSLGQMIAGIAHEITNPVNFIHGNLKYIDEYVQGLLQLVNLYQDHYPEPAAPIQEYLELINHEFVVGDLPKTLNSTKVGVDRLVQIVKSLHNFSRQDQTKTQRADIHQGLDSTLLILNHRLKRQIQIVKQYGSLPLVECYPAQLNQVFMNILNNAIDALLDDLEQPNKQITIATQLLESNQVEVQIQDNGPGIPPVVLDKLFDPFFTTKPAGKGIGLGLSICQQIIKRHQGTIAVDSSPKHGTTFLIRFAVDLADAIV